MPVLATKNEFVLNVKLTDFNLFRNKFKVLRIIKAVKNQKKN